MNVNYDDLNGPFGVALNEANLLGVVLDPVNRSAIVGFDCLSLREDAPPDPAYRRVTFAFSPVGRLAASLRNSRWDDVEAPTVPLQPSELTATIRELGNLSIHGWEFFDLGDTAFADAKNRLSFDWREGTLGFSHTLRLFQDANHRYLEVWLWFDSFRIFDEPAKTIVDLDEFYQSAMRWWAGMRAGDPRTHGFGIVPAGDWRPGAET